MIQLFFNRSIQLNLYLDTRGYSPHRVADTILAASKYFAKIVNRRFDGTNDVIIAHEILETSESTLFVILPGLEISCPDLVARALLSNDGVVLCGQGSQIRRYAPSICVDVNCLYTSVDDLITNIWEYPQIFCYNNPGPGTGCFDLADFLIVGERPGNKPSAGNSDAAFFSVESSSKWLREKINAQEFTQENFYWVNTFDRSGSETNWDFVQTLKPSKIVALGNIASVSLEHAGLEHVCIPHPQYWKRFKSKHEYPLTTILREFNENQH